MFYYFSKSTKRKCTLKTYYQFYDHESRQILKHINVQWLSLERAVECILKQYAGSQSYFLSEDAPATWRNSAWGGIKRFLRLTNAFKYPMTETYLMYFSGVLPTFSTINPLVQCEDSCIYLIHDALNHFLTYLAGRFMPVHTISLLTTYLQLI